tara:strand:+ start:510 stop:812 length:303 start_codon:yes stop_codon:yes gene_type:complete
MAYHRQQKHKTNYHDKPFERKHKKNYTPREEFRGYYAKVREGEDCMKAYRKIKKMMIRDGFFKELKDRESFQPKPLLKRLAKKRGIRNTRKRLNQLKYRS